MIPIATHSFRILLREKILYNVFGVTLLLLFFGYLASLLVHGHQNRVMIDLGTMINALSVFFIAVSVGGRSLKKEIETKTIYLHLVRPISRTGYYFGQFIGKSAFLILNFLLLTLALWIALWLVDGNVSPAFWQSFALTILESMILLSLSLLLSLWLRPALVFMILLAFVFLGHNHALISSLQNGIGFLNFLTPDLSVLLMADRVYYEEAIDFRQFLSAGLYGISWILIFTLLGNAVFSRKNL